MHVSNTLPGTWPCVCSVRWCVVDWWYRNRYHRPPPTVTVTVTVTGTGTGPGTTGTGTGTGGTGTTGHRYRSTGTGPPVPGPVPVRLFLWGGRKVVTIFPQQMGRHVCVCVPRHQDHTFLSSSSFHLHTIARWQCCENEYALMIRVMSHRCPHPHLHRMRKKAVKSPAAQKTTRRRSCLCSLFSSYAVVQHCGQC